MTKKTDNSTPEKTAGIIFDAEKHIEELTQRLETEENPELYMEHFKALTRTVDQLQEISDQDDVKKSIH